MDAQIADSARGRCEVEVKQAKIWALARKVERNRRRLEDMRLAYNRAKRQMEKLPMAIGLHACIDDHKQLTVSVHA